MHPLHIHLPEYVPGTGGRPGARPASSHDSPSADVSPSKSITCGSDGVLMAERTSQQRVGIVYHGMEYATLIANPSDDVSPSTPRALDQLALAEISLIVCQGRHNYTSRRMPHERQEVLDAGCAALFEAATAALKGLLRDHGIQWR